VRVEVASPARRDLSKLPGKVYDVVAETLRGPVASNPYVVSKPLRFELEGVRVVRRGDFRILLTIDDEQRVVTVLRVRHRSVAYGG
jgi:mRNA interferase RelE/StbE